MLIEGMPLFFHAHAELNAQLVGPAQLANWKSLRSRHELEAHQLSAVVGSLRLILGFSCSSTTTAVSARKVHAQHRIALCEKEEHAHNHDRQRDEDRFFGLCQEVKMRLADELRHRQILYSWDFAPSRQRSSGS